MTRLSPTASVEVREDSTSRDRTASSRPIIFYFRTCVWCLGGGGDDRHNYNGEDDGGILLLICSTHYVKLYGKYCTFVLQDRLLLDVEVGLVQSRSTFTI